MTNEIILPSSDTPVIEAALMYAAMGIAPVAVWGVKSDGTCACGDAACGGSAGKHPRRADWLRRATTDLDTVRDAFRGHRGNIGLVVTGHLVLDADAPGALEPLGELPETLTATTGRGRHVWFRLGLGQDARDIPQRSDRLPGVDVKTTGHVAVAPSQHYTGRHYEWKTRVPIAVLPDALYQRLRRPTRAPAPRLPVAVPRDEQARFKRCRAYVAKMPNSVSGQQGHTALMNVALETVRFGLGDAAALEVLSEYNQRAEPPWPADELERKRHEAVAKGRQVTPHPDRPRTGGRGATALAPVPHPDETAEPGVTPNAETDWRGRLLWRQTRNGAQIEKCAENAARILQLDPRWAGKVRLDEFVQNVSVTDPPWSDLQAPGAPHLYWTDSDTRRLQGWMLEQHGLSLPVSDIDGAVILAAERAAYHSARDWMRGLEWDGVPRLNDWMTRYLGAEISEYTRAVGRWWLISAVARCMQPGCKADHVLILEGRQGSGKSTALRTLASAPWFSDTPIDIGNKDAFQALSGRLIVELAELDSLRRADAERAKTFFSSSVDSYRPPYDRRVKSVPRSCVFAGTTNHVEYLRDETGARRFWPVACGDIDVAALASDREQIWAEAVAAYDEGASWYPVTASDVALLVPSQEARSEDADAWASIISEWTISNGISDTTATEVLERALKIQPGQMKRQDTLRAGAALRAIGFTPRTVRGGWSVPAKRFIRR